MAPFENLRSSDLAWISDFMVQQMLILLQPLLDHLQRTDFAMDRVAQRLDFQVSEVKGEIERTNKYLAILRQGLALQNESKCMVQLGLESAVRTVQRLDDQMQGVFGLMRTVEDNQGKQSVETHCLVSTQFDLAKKVANSLSAIEDVKARVEVLAGDARRARKGQLEAETRLEGWHKELQAFRELRDLREPQFRGEPTRRSSAGCGQVSSLVIASIPWATCSKQPPFCEAVPPNNRVAAWSQHQRRLLSASPADAGGYISGGDASRAGACGIHQDCGEPQAPQSRGNTIGGQRLTTRSVCSAESSLATDATVTCAAADEATSGIEASPGDTSRRRPLSGSARLPMLATRQLVSTKPPERASGGDAGGPRLRFTATMASPPPSRGGRPEAP